KNHSRGSHAMAARTRQSRIPRFASWLTTMRRRARRVSGAGPPIPHAPRLPSHSVNYSLTPSIPRPGPLPELIQHRILLVADGGADAVADALQAGAQDAMSTPVHFGELRARIDADLRLRRDMHEARDALRTRDLLFDIFQDVSATLRADEIFQTLVRRVG